MARIVVASGTSLYSFLPCFHVNRLSLLLVDTLFLSTFDFYTVFICISSQRDPTFVHDHPCAHVSRVNKSGRSQDFSNSLCRLASTSPNIRAVVSRFAGMFL